MKLIYILAFATLLIFSTSKIRKRSWKHQRHTKGDSDGKDLNLFYVFVKYAVVTLNQYADFLGKSSEIDSCLPQKVRAPNASELTEIQEAAPVTDNLNKQVDTWDKIKAYLKEGINFVCHFKSYLSEFKSYLINGFKSIFTSRRLFIRRNRRTRGIVGDFILKQADSFKNYSKQLADEIKKGVKIVKTAVKNTIEDAMNYIKSSFSDLFSPIIEEFNKIKDKVKEFWNSPLITKIRNYYETCAKGIVGLLKIIKNLFTTIASMAVLKPDTWFTVILRMICNWEKLSDAVDFIKNIKNPSPFVKWMGIGKFVGTLTYILGVDD